MDPKAWCPLQESNPHLELCINIFMNSCKHCFKLIPLGTYKKVFCSRSCSASFNNKNRKPRSVESREKTAASIKKLIAEGKLSSNLIPVNRISEFPFTRLYGLHSCNSCGESFWKTKSYQKCCSVECRDNIRSQNKCRKTHIRYFSLYDQKYVDLQSTWELEVAVWLDTNNVIWSRPSKRLTWNASNNTKRTYLPDFYLVKHEMFLDVKNPIKIEEDKLKISIIKTLIPLEVGNIQHIKTIVAGLEGFEPSCIH